MSMRWEFRTFLMADEPRDNHRSDATFAEVTDEDLTTYLNVGKPDVVKVALASVADQNTAVVAVTKGWRG